MIWVVCAAAIVCAILSFVYIVCVGWWSDNFVVVYVLGGLYCGFILLGVFLTGIEGIHSDYDYEFRPALYVSQFFSMMLFTGFYLFIKGTFINRWRYRNFFDHVEVCITGIALLLVITVGLSFVPFFVTANEKIERWCLDAVEEESIEGEICAGIRQKFTNNSAAEHVWNGFREHPDSKPALNSIVESACLENRDSDEYIKVLDNLNETAEEHYVLWNFEATLRDVQEVCPLYRKDLVDALTKTDELRYP